MINAQNGCTFAMMNCHYIRYPIEYFLDSMKHFGISRIELFGAMPHFYIMDADDTLIMRVKNACAERGIRIVSFTPAQGAYPVSISSDEEPVRRRSIEMAKRSMDVAAKLGAPTMLISPGYGYQNTAFDMRWGICRESFLELAAYAERVGVTLMVEPLTPGTSNIINTSMQSAKMLQEVNSPYLKSIMDIGVMNFMNESVDSYFDNLGSDLVYVHFTDGPGMHVALGDGTFPMNHYLERILARGYQGTLSFEINDKRYLQDPNAATQRNVDWINARRLFL